MCSQLVYLLPDLEGKTVVHSLLALPQVRPPPLATLSLGWAWWRASKELALGLGGEMAVTALLQTCGMWIKAGGEPDRSPRLCVNISQVWKITKNRGRNSQ